MFFFSSCLNGVQAAGGLSEGSRGEEAAPGMTQESFCSFFHPVCEAGVVSQGDAEFGRRGALALGAGAPCPDVGC